MRVVFATVIVASILYFLGGWVAVSFGFIPREIYFQYAGIVGGFASVAGLLSLTRPPLTSTDLKELEIDSMKSITSISEELQSLEAARSTTQEEILALEAQKKEMALLVRKASMALFLQEQYAAHERQIVETIAANADLREHLTQVDEIAEKLAALNEEIDQDPRVTQLKDIIATARRRKPALDEILLELPPFVRASVLASREISRAVNNIIANLGR